MKFFYCQLSRWTTALMVHHSTHMGGSHVTITHGALELIVQGTPWPWPSWTWDFWGPLPQPQPTSDIWWSPLGTCSNLFTSGPSPMGLTSGGNWNRYGQGKQAVHIILKCFLVNFKIHLIQVIRKKKIYLGGGSWNSQPKKHDFCPNHHTLHRHLSVEDFKIVTMLHWL